MFKALSLYTFLTNKPINKQALAEKLNLHRFVPCGAAQEKSVGWVTPRPVDFSEYIEARDGHILLELKVERKSVPAAQIKEELKKRCEAIEKEFGRKPGRREKKDLKDTIKAEMLPRAFPKATQIPMWLDTNTNFLMVGSTSKAMLDIVIDELTIIFAALGNPAMVAPINNQRSILGEMTAWLSTDEFPEDFDRGHNLLLKFDKTSVRYTKHSLNSSDIKTHLEKGFHPEELQLMHGEHTSFVLTPSFNLKKIDFVDIEDLSEDLGEDATAFDADFFIFTSQMSEVISKLSKIFEVEMPSLDI